MPAPRAFNGKRLKFLKDQLEPYAKADSEGHAAEFALDVARRFLKRFPVTRPDEEEPTDEELQAVNDNAADEDLVAPVQNEGVSDEEHAKALAAFADVQKKTTFKVQQIQRWLKNWSKKGEDSSASRSYQAILRDPLRKWVITRLVGLEEGPGRRRAAFVLFGKKNAAKIDALLRQRLGMLDSQGIEGSVLEGSDEPSNTGEGLRPNTDGGEGSSNAEATVGEEDFVIIPKKLSKKGEDAQVALRQDIAITEFAKLSLDEKQLFETLAREEHEDRIQQWKEKISAPFPTDPASRQRAIESLASTLQPILDLVHEATGWNVTVMAGGPEPADAGRLNIMSIHAGLTADPTPMNFGAANRAMYKKFVLPVFGNFLMKCFSIEECRRRRLPDTPSLSTTLSTSSGINHDTVTDTMTLPTDAPVPTVPATRTVAPKHTPAPNNFPQKIRMLNADRLSARVTHDRISRSNGDSPMPGVPASLSSPVTPKSVTPTRPVIEGRLEPPPSSQPRPWRAASLPPSPMKSATSTPFSSPVRDNQRIFSPATVESSPVRDDDHVTPSSPTFTPSVSVSAPVRKGKAKFVGVVIENKSKTHRSHKSPLKVPKVESEDEKMAEDSLKEEEDSEIEFLGFVKAPPAKKKRTSSGKDTALTNSPKKKRTSSGRDTPPATSPTPSSSKVSRQSEPSPPTFTVNTPSCAPDYVMKVLSLCHGVGMDRSLRDVVVNWLRLEEAGNYGAEGSVRLSTQGRPRAVADWIARARSQLWRPDLSTLERLERYNDEFVEWFKTCSPEWRERSEHGILMSRKAGQDWSIMERFGPNGLASLVAALAWWKEAVEKLPYDTPREQQRKRLHLALLEDALNEVNYSFRSTHSFLLARGYD
ncbi:SERTA domain-containing protein 3 [Paramarasmius palmivorus]|uniref:SERTA domain-containing protein 3 n=1 Tax=Paramarasmius palmivorus TaxID=297713 RepID=A0AAW0AQY0_9AGAR